MKKKIERNYLEIYSLSELNDKNYSPKDYSVKLIEPANFQLNKFFYKSVGKKHHWVDRLIWNENQWIEYTTDEKVKTFVLKKSSDDLVGYFELIIHKDKDEVEIAYLGLLEEYHNKKLGSFLLTSAIKESFIHKPKA